MKPNPIFYRADDPAAVFAAKRDADFFARHPRAVWRVRPLIEGESPLVDQMRRTGMRAYAVVIYHARAGDKRQRRARHLSGDAGGTGPHPRIAAVARRGAPDGAMVPQVQFDAATGAAGPHGRDVRAGP